MLNLTVEDFVAQTAAKSSTPGGGSVAGVVGSLAAALGEMSLNFTIGKKKFADFAELHQKLATELADLRQKSLELIDADVKAYQKFCDINKLPDSPTKQASLYDALIESIEVPAELANTMLTLLKLLDTLKDKCNHWLISDLVAAARLAVAVSALCDFNVRINARNLEDKTLAQDYRNRSADARKLANKIADEIESAVANLLD